MRCAQGRARLETDLRCAAAAGSQHRLLAGLPPPPPPAPPRTAPGYGRGWRTSKGRRHRGAPRMCRRGSELASPGGGFRCSQQRMAAPGRVVGFRSEGTAATRRGAGRVRESRPGDVPERTEEPWGRTCPPPPSKALRAPRCPAADSLSAHLDGGARSPAPRAASDPEFCSLRPALPTGENALWTDPLMCEPVAWLRPRPRSW